MFINLSPKNDWYTWDDIIHQSYFKMWNIDTHQSNRLITRENNYKFTTNGFQMYFAILSSYKSYFNYKNYNRAFVIGLEIQYRQKLSHEKQLLYVRHKHETYCAGQVIILSMFISYVKKILLKKKQPFL